MYYQLWNSGLADAVATQTKFFWSNDSIFDASDILLGSKIEASLTDTSFQQRAFIYTKQNNTQAVYYIFYVLDAAHQINEMFEENDTGYFKIQQQAALVIPYFNDFESQIDGWSHNASVGHDDWQWDVPQGAILNQAFSGTKAWNSNAFGAVSSNSRMHLFTPVFDLASADNPVIEFDMENVGDGACYCFVAKSNLSYSVDGGATWQVLDTGNNNSFKNWYYWNEWDDYGGIESLYYIPIYSTMFYQPTENSFVPSTYFQGRDADRTTHYVVDAKELKGHKKVQLRFNLSTRENNINEGVVIDNFTVREKFTDLMVPYKKTIITNSLSGHVQFFMHLKNTGNYIAPATTTKFYLSIDSTYSANDAYIGQYSTPAIRPDMRQYLNFTGNAPANQKNYHYLIYSLDAGNAIAESDESNNTGYWKFAVDSMLPLPYFNDFSDSILDGWYEKTESDLEYQHRFRNMLAPNDWAAGTNATSGMWFTDRINNTMYNTWVPDLYLYTPSFSFKTWDSIVLSFDAMCAGGNGIEGGNMQYATDGDNYSVMMYPPTGAATNWYGTQTLTSLGEPGWGMLSTLTPITYNASSLRGDSAVIFRYRFKSNADYSPGYSNQGFWLDNFKVDGYYGDYFAVDTDLVINAGMAPQVDILYHILNDGQTNGRASNVKFYWSTDSIFDASDLLIDSAGINGISEGTLETLTRTISSPLLTQPIYYLFYKADAKDVMKEINEHNNTGRFEVVYDYNGIATVESQNISAFLLQNNLMVDVTNFSKENAVLEFENALGQKIFSSNIQLLPGKNHFEFPQHNLAAGIYFVMVEKKSGNYMKKMLSE